MEEPAETISRRMTRSSSSTSRPLRWNFDIDRYLNPIVLSSFLGRLPASLSRFLGYRSEPPPPLGNLIVCLWAFFGVLGGVSLVMAVDESIPAFRVNNTPTTIGGVGSAAVLLFYAIESPFSQPRNAILAQVMSSFVGVCVTKLFMLGGDETFQSLRWLAGGVACACATALMALSGTIHPPAGAMVLVAVMDSNARHLGWKLVPAVLLDCVLMVTTALLLNNIQRRYPQYWWTSGEVGQVWDNLRKKRKRKNQQARQQEEEEEDDDEQQHHGTVFKTTSRLSRQLEAESGSQLGRRSTRGTTRTRRTQQTTSENLEEAMSEFSDEDERIVITRGLVTVPENMYLRPEERMILESLSDRLRRQSL